MARRVNPKRLEAMQKALQLRIAGAPYAHIGRHLGISAAGAYKLTQAAIRMAVIEPAEELRRIELERLDMLQARWWPRALEDERALALLLRILEMRARLLGLYTEEPTVQVQTVEWHVTVVPSRNEALLSTG